MKKLLALLLALCMVLGMAACADTTDNAKDSQSNQDDSQGGQTDNAEVNAGGTDGKPSGEGGSVESVALILPGVITDESWNYTAYEGLMELQAAGYEVAYVENTDTSNCEAVALNYVSEGYDLIIAHGSQFGDAMIRVAETYPDNYFFVYGKAPVDDYSDNIGFVDTAVYTATYACGYLAAKVSETGVIGYIGGTESAGQLSMKNGYIQGAEAANPDISVLSIMTGNTEDTALGKESALSMIDQNADVIMHAADTTGLGVIEACKERDVYVIGYGSDQHDLAPDLMLTSVVEIVPPVITGQVDRIEDGSFGGVYKPGLGVGVELASFADGLSEELIEEVNGVVEDIVDGAITVEESYD